MDYLDEDTIRGRSYLTEAQWADTGMGSNFENEKEICAASARDHEYQEKMQDGKSRLIWSEGISRLIPRSDRSVQVKRARKIHATQRQKKNLDGLYKVLAPGSAVGKICPTTGVLKEPNWLEDQELKYRKIGSRNERDTELGQYIEKRLTKVQGKLLNNRL